jgi:polyisoprenoid-binding protein YceI
MFAAMVVNAQEKVATKSGEVKFEASTKNFEPVAAVNKATSAVLKNDGTFAVLILVKGFQFKKALMQEHFNQPKYMHTEKFPKASFKGTMMDFDMSKLTEKDGEYRISGVLNIHGVDNEISTMALVKKVDGKVQVSTNFAVKVEDYGIEIKSKLAKKIAETVNISMQLNLK